MSEIQYGITSFTQQITEPKMFPYANDTTSGGNINKERNLVKLIRSLMNKSFAVTEGSYDISFVAAIGDNGRPLGYEDIYVAPGVAVVGGYYVESQRTITISGNDGHGNDKFSNITVESENLHVYLWLGMDGNGNNVIEANIQIGELPTDGRPYLDLGTIKRGDNNKLTFTPDKDKYAMINLANLYTDQSVQELSGSSLVQIIQQVTTNLISSGISGGTLVLNEIDGNPDKLILKYGTVNNPEISGLPEGKIDETYGVIQLIQQFVTPGGATEENKILEWTYGHMTEGLDFSGTANDVWTTTTPWVQESPMFYMKLWANSLKCSGVFEAPGIVCTPTGVEITSPMIIKGTSLKVDSPATFNNTTTFETNVDLSSNGKVVRGDHTIIDTSNNVYGAVWN